MKYSCLTNAVTAACFSWCAWYFGSMASLFKNVWPFKKQKPAVIFDLDGTLVDTKELIYKSFIHTFEKYKLGYHLSEEELKSFFGTKFKKILFYVILMKVRLMK